MRFDLQLGYKNGKKRDMPSHRISGSIDMFGGKTTGFFPDKGACLNLHNVSIQGIGGDCLTLIGYEQRGSANVYQEWYLRPCIKESEASHDH